MENNLWIKKALTLGTVFFLAVLLVKPIGVSTQFSVLSGIFHSALNETVITEDAERESGYRSTNPYYDKSDGKLARSIEHPWNYDFVFVLAIPFGGYLAYLANDKKRRSQMSDVDVTIPSTAKSDIRRYFPSFLGGFILLYGARMADGCTSGHMMSGMMQGSIRVSKKSSGILRKGNRLVVYRFIDDNKDYFGLRWLCAHFGISSNCYYNYLDDKKSVYREQREVIYERIKYIYYNNNRTVGHRAMRIFLSRYGIYLSKTTVHKHMNKALNLVAIIMRKKPGYKSSKKHKIFDNLLKQNFEVHEKNKVWCTDFTYMRQPNGKFRYNCSIIDLFDRSAIVSINDNYINTELAIKALTKALEQEKPSKWLILHSDQGVQFASWEFVVFCKEHGIIQSMSKAGCPYDNAPMERFYNTFKNCFYYRFTFDSVEKLDEMTKEYINWYNYVRPHSYNNYLTPMEVRFN